MTTQAFLLAAAMALLCASPSPAQDEPRPQTAQAPDFDRYCNLGLGKVVGERWLDADPYTGNKVTFRLVSGRQEDRPAP